MHTNAGIFPTDVCFGDVLVLGLDNSLLCVYAQVSITAEQNSRLVTWNSSRLRQQLDSDLHLSMVFDLVIGNDIASKLYSIRCRPRHAAASGASLVRVPATRSLPLQLNVGDSHRSVRDVRANPDRPEQLPLKLRLPSFVGEPRAASLRRYLWSPYGIGRPYIFSSCFFFFFFLA